MSAIGSVIMMNRPLPARLDDAGNLAAQRQIPKTDPAHLELPEEPSRPSTDAAPIVLSDLELRLPPVLDYLRQLCHR